MKKLKKISFAVTTIIMMLVMSISAFAEGGLENSILVVGTKNLINDATLVISGLGVLVAACGSGFFLIRRATANEQEKLQWDNRIKTCLVSGIGVAIVSSLVNVIAGYFGA